MTVVFQFTACRNRIKDLTDLRINKRYITCIICTESADFTRVQTQGFIRAISRSKCPRGRSPAGGRGIADGISSGSYILA